MTTITNTSNLTPAIERFLAKNEYSKGDSDFSVSTLIDSPQISSLKAKHDDEIVEDVADKIMAVVGTAVHTILHESGDPADVLEERFYTTINGVKISGQVDRMKMLEVEDGLDDPSNRIWEVQDYKTVAGSSFIYNPDGKIEWEKQLNCYAFLAEENGYDVRSLSVGAFVRDWSRSQATRDTRFPKKSIIEVPIKLWSKEERRAYIEERVALHTQAEPGPCIDEERWKGKDTFAVYEYSKKGGFKGRAKRVLPSMTEAQSYIIDNNLNAEVVMREGRAIRCADNFCLVNQFCKQYQDSL